MATDRHVVLKHNLHLLLALCLASPVSAQVARLPPVDLTGEGMPVQYIAPAETPSPGQVQLQPFPGATGPAYPSAANDLAAPPGPWPSPAEAAPPPYAAPAMDVLNAWPPGLGMPAPSCQAADPDTPRDARSGVFQKLFVTDTWLARLDEGGLGMNDLEVGSVWGIPLPTRNWPMLITPGVAAHWLDGPAVVDLPPRVYDAYTEFRWLPRLSPDLRVSLAVAPGYYSDFHASKDAVRITGDGAAIWQWMPKMKLVLGAAYLDRRDVAVLPIAGVSWTPSDEWKLDMVFPKPKLARRVYWSGTYSPEIEDWLYISGELGGGIWAFERTGGVQDVFSYRDYRVMLGVERKVLFRLSTRAEVGYVFGRKIQFESDSPDIRPTDTVMVRGGVTY